MEQRPSPQQIDTIKDLEQWARISWALLMSCVTLVSLAGYVVYSVRLPQPLRCSAERHS